MFTESWVPVRRSKVPDSLSPALLNTNCLPLSALGQPLAGEEYFAGAKNCVDSGMPCCSAAARKKALNVEPGWTPNVPPVARLTWVCPLALLSPYGRSTAIARIAPTPGSTMSLAAATPLGSPLGSWESTAVWAAAWTRGSSVV